MPYRKKHKKSAKANRSGSGNENGNGSAVGSGIGNGNGIGSCRSGNEIRDGMGEREQELQYEKERRIAPGWRQCSAVSGKRMTVGTKRRKDDSSMTVCGWQKNDCWRRRGGRAL